MRNMRPRSERRKEKFAERGIERERICEEERNDEEYEKREKVVKL